MPSVMISMSSFDGRISGGSRVMNSSSMGCHGSDAARGRAFRFLSGNPAGVAAGTDELAHIRIGMRGHDDRGLDHPAACLQEFLPPSGGLALSEHAVAINAVKPEVSKTNLISRCRTRYVLLTSGLTAFMATACSERASPPLGGRNSWRHAAGWSNPRSSWPRSHSRWASSSVPAATPAGLPDKNRNARPLAASGAMATHAR